MTIDDYVQQHGVARLDAMKLDVEGGEAAALAGATEVLERLRPVLEINATALDTSGAAASQVEELLVAAGYEAFAIDDRNASLTPVAPGSLSSTSRTWCSSRARPRVSHLGSLAGERVDLYPHGRAAGVDGFSESG